MKRVMGRWNNIFGSCELVEYDDQDYYLIRWSIHNNCVVLRNGISIVDDPRFIFEKYNIFDGRMIVVDMESFREEVHRSFEWIRTIIVEQYEISYVKKLLLCKKLRYSQLELFLGECGCSLIASESVEEECYIMKIRDNLGLVWKVDGRFHEGPFDQLDPYWSYFEILERVE
jgi:hypothetical protein